VPWAALGGARCGCGAAPQLSGPLWLGQLHDAAELAELAALADELGWSQAPPFEPGTDDAAAAPQRSLGSLLALLLAEADEALPPGYITLDDVATRAGTRTPSRDALIAALRDGGHVAARTHCADRALKTNAPWQAVLDAARAVTA
jgi:tRNA (guanine26-N2/guanine27-N2)-dimethyltransferase